MALPILATIPLQVAVSAMDNGNVSYSEAT